MSIDVCVCMTADNGYSLNDLLKFNIDILVTVEATQAPAVLT